jgi:hypothetical protein
MFLDQWGPLAWELFHYITYTYKDELKEYYTLFFNTIYYILPCPHCALHIKTNLSEYNNLPDKNINNRPDFIDWLINVHNIVNNQTKNTNIFDRTKADEKYLTNKEINIDHTRVLSFIKMFIIAKMNERKINKNFIRNIIALCHIYPFKIDYSSEELIRYGKKNKITQENANEWYNNFEKIILEKKYKLNSELSIIKQNRLIENEDIYINAYKFERSKKLGTKIEVKNNRSIIFEPINDSNIFMINTYKILSDLDQVKIFIHGKSFGNNDCKIKIIVNTNKDNRKIEFINKEDKTIIIDMTNIKKDDQLNIFLSTINNKKGNKYIIDYLYILDN